MKYDVDDLDALLEDVKEKKLNRRPRNVEEPIPRRPKEKVVRKVPASKPVDEEKKVVKRVKSAEEEKAVVKKVKPIEEEKPVVKKVKPVKEGKIVPKIVRKVESFKTVDSVSDLDLDVELSEVEDIPKVTKESKTEKVKKSKPKKDKKAKIKADASAEASTEQEEEKKKKKGGVWIYNVVIVIAALVFVYCAYSLISYYYQGHKWKKNNAELQGIVGDIQKDVEYIEPVINDIYFPDELVYATVSQNYNPTVSEEWKAKYEELVSKNQDCVGWLLVPDTEINYPVMYTPGDPEKYLYKNFEGEYLKRGLPFMSEYTLLNKSQNYIVYGHNMADGTAFGTLQKYLDKDFAMNHKYIYFNTAYAEGVYILMDVVLTKIYPVDADCFKYYKYSGELSPDDFNTYVYYMNNMSQFNTGVSAVYGDQLLTLSTCHRVYDPEGRLVVVFKRIQ